MTIRDPAPAGNTDHSRQAARPVPLVEAMPLSLLDEPLAYIFADHFRQRTICSALRRFALAGKVDRNEAEAVVAFLNHDVPLDHEDEEKDLFPAVRRRALQEDNLGVVLARLLEDHRLAKPVIGQIVAELSCQPADVVKVSSAARELMQAYASSESSHLALENGIVLAIARIRLTRGDLDAMARGMKARRGVAN